MRRTALASALLAALLASAPARADRRDQKAADLYADGRALIQKGKYKEGIEKINQAIARGATEPNDEQGAESRFRVKRYDPYYWLGVAQMEMGLDEQALQNFEKSAAFVDKDSGKTPIRAWKDEWTDLQSRKGRLEAKLQAALAPPTPVVVAQAPTATPVAVAHVAPTPAPPAVPSPTIAIRIALSTPPPSSTRGPETIPIPPAPALTLADALRAGLAAYAAGRWDEAVSYAEAGRRADPKAPQPEVLACASLASQYLLGGRRNTVQIQSARERLAVWREKARRPGELPRFLSPALHSALQ